MEEDDSTSAKEGVSGSLSLERLTGALYAPILLD